MINCKFENGNKASLRHCTVDVVLFNKSKTKILLAKRADYLTEPGKWCLPGGYMDRDETLLQAVEREAYEETGCKITDIKFETFIDILDRPGDDRQDIDFAYSAIAGDQTGKPDEESSEICWFDLNSLPGKSQIAFDHYDLIKLITS